MDAGKTTLYAAIGWKFDAVSTDENIIAFARMGQKASLAKLKKLHQ